MIFSAFKKQKYAFPKIRKEKTDVLNINELSKLSKPSKQQQGFPIRTIISAYYQISKKKKRPWGEFDIKCQTP